MPTDEVIAQLHGYIMTLSFVLGTLVGSFANVCICRWPAGESVIKPRSRCPKCGKAIAWYDNIPLLSWLILLARCRHCKLPIPWRYPAVELLCGLLFLATYARFGFSLASPVYMAICASMVIVTFQDLDDWTIPNEITLPGIPIGVGIAIVGMFYPESLLRVTDPIDALIGIALGGGILYTLDRVTVVLLKKPGMGMGDVKLLAMLGAFIGWKGIWGALMLASIIGSFVGLSMMLYFSLKGAPAQAESEKKDDEKKQSPKTREEEEDEMITLEGHYLPFGPYLAVAGLIFLFFGPEIIAWYFSGLGGALPFELNTLP